VRHGEIRILGAAAFHPPLTRTGAHPTTPAITMPQEYLTNRLSVATRSDQGCISGGRNG